MHKQTIRDIYERLGVLPFLLLGVMLLFLSMLALSHIANSFYPFDVQRLDLLRATGLDQIDAPAILEAPSHTFVFAFLTSVLLAVTGITMPLVYYLNRRFDPAGRIPGPFLVLRQSMWVGFWAAFCVWLQMNRALGVAVAVLVAVILILFEVLLQVRLRAMRGVS